jgi:hypothetical protein
MHPYFVSLVRLVILNLERVFFAAFINLDSSYFKLVKKTDFASLLSPTQPTLVQTKSEL